MNITGGAVVGLASVALMGAAAYLLVKKGVNAAGKVADALNPTSDKNLAYTGVNALGAAATGDKDFALGSWIYNITHADYDPNYVAPATQSGQNYNGANRGIGVGGWGFDSGSTTSTKATGAYNYDPAYVDKLLNGQMTAIDYLMPPPEWSAVGGYK